MDLAPEEGSSDSPIEIVVDEEPAVEIAPASSPEDEAPELEVNNLSAVSLEDDAVPAEQEPKALVLELDEGPEPESPPPSRNRGVRSESGN